MNHWDIAGVMDNKSDNKIKTFFCIASPNLLFLNSLIRISRTDKAATNYTKVPKTIVRHIHAGREMVQDIRPAGINIPCNSTPWMDILGDPCCLVVASYEFVVVSFIDMCCLKRILFFACFSHFFIILLTLFQHVRRVIDHR